MQRLGTNDYRGVQWPGFSQEDEDEGYPLYVYHLPIIWRDINDVIHVSPLVMKVKSRTSSIRSGASTPGFGGFSKSLSEKDLQKADEALSNAANMDAPTNGH